MKVSGSRSVELQRDGSIYRAVLRQWRRRRPTPRAISDFFNSLLGRLREHFYAIRSRQLLLSSETPDHFKHRKAGPREEQRYDAPIENGIHRVDTFETTASTDFSWPWP